MAFSVTTDFTSGTVAQSAQVNQNFADVEGVINSTGTYSIVPIGAIIAWNKSMTGVPSLPANFLECDGSVISDADSPMDGETLPDLNGNNNALRGNSTSGGTNDHTHEQSIGTDGTGGSIRTRIGASWYAITGAAVGFSTGAAPGNRTTIGTTVTHYDVVWIMRIK